MCGISGLWSFAGGDEAALRERAVAMSASLRHRGPDDDGVWVDSAVGVALSFRRLSIIDLTPAGAQPMLSASGRYVIVFNGEVYNSVRLRGELGPRPFHGRSDTEVMLECIDAWGLEKAVQRFIGMFAFALWDRQERRLSLVRDRIGVKPLYYALSSKELTFASELKALGRGEIDRGALSLYIHYGYIPAPHSIFRGVSKLLPGQITTIEESGAIRSAAYWDSAALAEAAQANPFDGSEEEALDAVEALLRDSVRLRMISDVPLGLFLSSGIDSPLVAALMRQETTSVATFTIGFKDLPSEAPHAAAVARHLGTRHTEAVIGARDVLDAVPLMATVYDEPLGDSSSVPTFLVSQMARQHVTVALSGDGGDELFGGYHRYFLGQRLDARVRRVPRSLRRPLGTALRRASVIPFRRNVRDRLRGLGTALQMDNPLARFLRDMRDETVAVRQAPFRAFVLNAREQWPRLDNHTELMMYLDAMSFLPDGILTKVDRASMAVSLEVREPLLDHRLVELAWSLPLSLKMRDGRGKWILRKLLSRHLPDAMITREKFGFGLPIDAWLSGPLHAWAASLVDPGRIAREGFFEPAGVRRVWRNGPVPGREGPLWRLLMFQQWLEALQERAGDTPTTIPQP